MALTKKEKVKLVKDYESLLKDAENVIVIAYEAIPVSVSVAMRKEFKKEGSMYKVVKKRVFAKALENLGYEVDLKNLSNAISVLFTKDDGVSSLKVVENFKKDWKKAKAPSKMEYLWGWFNWEWKDADYVKVLSSIPSKEELVWKLLYMMKYPIQWFVTVNKNVLTGFVRVLDQIKEKK